MGFRVFGLLGRGEKVCESFGNDAFILLDEKFGAHWFLALLCPLPLRCLTFTPSLSPLSKAREGANETRSLCSHCRHGVMEHPM